MFQGRSVLGRRGPGSGDRRSHGCLQRMANTLTVPLGICSIANLRRVGSLDNCNFSDRTVWGEHEPTFHFSSSRPPGKVIIAEGTHLASVPDGTYDFILSSHNLEHFANPVKALVEWKRITRPRGALVLVLPHYRSTFDHLRPPTSVDHMFDDYRFDIGEDDTTHLDEVVRLHDITIDGFLKTGLGKSSASAARTIFQTG